MRTPALARSIGSPMWLLLLLKLWLSTHHVCTSESIHPSFVFGFGGSKTHTKEVAIDGLKEGMMVVGVVGGSS